MSDSREKSPWVSLDDEHRPDRQAFGDPEHLAADFAGAASDGPSRRGFLKVLGLSAASMAACERLPVRRAIPYLVPPEEITPGVPTWYASTCLACPANCGTLVKVLDGRPVKIEGNPEHPGSRGGLCAIGQADLRALYDPERLRQPSIDGQAVTWDALDSHVRSRLAGLGPERAVYVFAGSVGGPALRAAIEQFVAPYGGVLVEHDLDPQAPGALPHAYGLLDGRNLVPALHLDDVDLLVSFGADLFGTGPDPVGHTAAWAARRRAGELRGAPRFVQIEGSMSLSGGNADERWLATTAERRHMALWLARELASRLGVTGAAEVRAALAGLDGDPVHAGRLASVVDRLIEVPGRSLLISNSDDEAEQLAVAICNRLLGNEGRTLDLERPVSGRRGDDVALAAFREDLAAGRVGAVVVLDADPVGRLPDGDELATQLAALPLSVAISARPSATTAACQVVAAAHQGMERWADAEPRPGLRTLAQPTIRPIFDTRDPGASFLVWAGNAITPWRDYLRTSWGSPDAAEWAEVVRTAGLGALGVMSAWPDGGATAGRPQALSSAATDVLAAAAADPHEFSEDAVEIELVTEVSCRHAGHAGNPWLRELPDPMTRVSWHGCARIAPDTARAAGITDGTFVEVAVDGVSVALPAVVMPGQHPGVVAVPLGYPTFVEAGAGGPSVAEAVAPLAAYGVARSAPWSPRWRGRSGELQALDRYTTLPRMQVHAQTEGRPIVHQVSAHGEAVHVPHHPDADLWDERPETSPQWGMVIDLNACVGCGGCVIACQAENNIPVVGADQIKRHRDMYWLRIDRYFVGDPAEPETLFEPMLCAQCDHAPCETVCPVAATVQSEDGLNQQIYNRCVGTRYCANNCPYKVRRFNWYSFEPTDPIERLVLNPDVVVRSRGVMEKCTFCVQRIQAGRIEARREGRDAFAVSTACQQSCPAQAIQFGDATAAAGPLVEATRAPRAFQVLAELGVRPSVTYLARVRSRTDAHDGPAAADPAEHGGAP